MGLFMKIIERMSVLIGLTLVFSPHDVKSANILSKAIEAAQPCESLKVETVVGSIGIDKFKEANIEKLNLLIDGNQASLTGTAMLACRTSDDAVVKGDASATVSLDATLDLNSCEMSQLDVKLVETSGTFEDVLDAFEDGITGAIKGVIADEIKKLCR
jgi:hypothetical protein